MLRAGPRFGSGADGAAVGVRIRFGEGHLAVAARVGVAQQARGEIVGEEAARDLVGLLGFLVGGRGGDEHQAARVGAAGALHVEGGHGPHALHAGDGARLARIEEPDAHVGRRLLQALAQLAERQSGVAQPQLAVLGVPRVVDEEQRLLAVLARRSGPPVQIVESAADVPRVGAREQARVFLAHAAQADEDGVDAAGVALGVPELPRSRAALRVAHHQGEAVHVGARRAGCDQQRDRHDPLHLRRSKGTCTTSDPLGAAFAPSRRSASGSRGLSANTARSVARRAVPVHSKASGKSERAAPA